MHVISSDETSRLVPLELGKSVVIEFPQDIKDVLIANPDVVSAVVRTSRRVYIIGGNLGETNVYLYNGAGQQIGALDVSVVSYPVRDTENTKVVMIFRGGAEFKFSSLSCTSTLCLGAEKGEAPNTTHQDITYHNRP